VRKYQEKTQGTSAKVQEFKFEAFN